MEKPRKYDYLCYLDSPWWKMIKAQRMRLDGNKCVFCKSTKNLNVHHRNYDNCGHENLFEDLVTLCERCHMAEHKRIEQAKEDAKLFREISFQQYLLLLNDFCKLHEHLDLSAGGTVNFLRIGVVKEYASAWLEERGIDPPGGYVDRIKKYFIDKRHSIIDQLLEDNPDITVREIVSKTKFNEAFVRKYLNRKGVISYV